MTLQPEVEDFHMPNAGVAHNMVIVKIKKSYPGQGMKVIGSLSGAGQMMFTKYMIVVSGEINIRNYRELAAHIFANADLCKDLLFSNGPLDVLDHSSDSFSFGGKMGIDATIKHIEESNAGDQKVKFSNNISGIDTDFIENDLIKSHNLGLFAAGIPIIIISVDRSADNEIVEKVKDVIRTKWQAGNFKLILIVDHSVDVNDMFMVSWQILANSDPRRDHEFIFPESLIIDGTIKAGRKGGFPRRWPNIVSSDSDTIAAIDKKWDSLGIGEFIVSPSSRYKRLCRKGGDEILIE
jgi:4-hydroxy-3-polyprenylbenzoate decarboxylase